MLPTNVYRTFQRFVQVRRNRINWDVVAKHKWRGIDQSVWWLDIAGCDGFNLPPTLTYTALLIVFFIIIPGILLGPLSFYAALYVSFSQASHIGWKVRLCNSSATWINCHLPRVNEAAREPLSAAIGMQSTAAIPSAPSQVLIKIWFIFIQWSVGSLSSNSSMETSTSPSGQQTSKNTPYLHLHRTAINLITCTKVVMEQTVDLQVCRKKQIQPPDLFSVMRQYLIPTPRQHPLLRSDAQ